MWWRLVKRKKNDNIANEPCSSAYFFLYTCIHWHVQEPTPHCQMSICIHSCDEYNMHTALKSDNFCKSLTPKTVCAVINQLRWAICVRCQQHPMLCAKWVNLLKYNAFVGSCCCYCSSSQFYLLYAFIGLVRAHGYTYAEAAMVDSTFSSRAYFPFNSLKVFRWLSFYLYSIYIYMWVWVCVCLKAHICTV